MSMSFISLILFVLLALVTWAPVRPVWAYPFEDVTEAAGILRQYGPRKTYGGPAVADIDGDGWPDLLLGHHGGRDTLQVYFNSGNGTFEKSGVFLWRDLHGINPFRASPRTEGMHFICSGGGRRGTSPRPSHLFEVLPNRTIREVTAESPHFEQTLIRGRSAIAVSMRANPTRRRRPDILLLNAYDEFTPEQRHFAFQVNGRNRLRLPRQTLGPDGLRNGKNVFGGVTDMDNDGVMELVLLDELKIWRLQADFQYVDITQSVLPARSRMREQDYVAAWSFAELDYDNDGRWDLFVARSATGHFQWYNNRLHRYPPLHDALFRNVNGTHYEDMIGASGIVNATSNFTTHSHAVTAGDFDNDGLTDLFIVRYTADPAYVLLRNAGNGTFEVVPHGFGRPDSVDGDAVTAVDYDMDGRLDLVVSEGSWDTDARGGYYRVMKNVARNSNGFLLVRVKNAPGQRVTSLHATVTARFADGSQQMRRVGSPGVTVSVSYIETVHFGMGKWTTCDDVTVRWTDGSVESRRFVAANSTIEFGV